MHPTGRLPFISSEGVAVRRPGLALESLARREHARQRVQIPIDSLGIAQPVAPAHARGHPPSTSIRGRPSSWPASYIARLTQRCNGRALKALRLSALIVF